MNYLIILLLSIISIQPLKVKSPVFGHQEYIPFKYTCEGSDINPPLEIENIPSETKSLALIVDDPDAPGGTVDHWLMWNIPVKRRIEENSSPGIQGKNSKKQNRYMGPCPPSGIHEYRFKVYALDVNLILPTGANRKSLEKAMEGHIVGYGELTGLYKKIVEDKSLK